MLQRTYTHNFWWYDYSYPYQGLKIPKECHNKRINMLDFLGYDKIQFNLIYGSILPHSGEVTYAEISFKTWTPAITDWPQKRIWTFSVPNVACSNTLPQERKITDTLSHSHSLSNHIQHSLYSLHNNYIQSWAAYHDFQLRVKGLTCKQDSNLLRRNQ